MFPFKDIKAPLEQRIDDLMSRLTLDERINLITIFHRPIERLGIPAFRIGGEAAHGIVDRLKVATTVFPQTFGLAATFSKKTIREVGECVGDEARGYYDLTDEYAGLMLWSPTVDMLRDPRWGRTEEGYSEDPHLTSKLSCEYVKGLQGTDPDYLKMVSAPKHFYGNNHEEDRIADNSNIDPRNKYEFYMIPYEECFKEGRAGSMMCAYNKVNGIPAMFSPDLNETIRGRYDFDGFVICDGQAIVRNVQNVQYRKTFAEEFALALKRGCDCFNDSPQLVEASARLALERGYMTEEDLDAAVRNILRMRFKVGNFDAEKKDPYRNIKKDVIACKKHEEMSLRATEESIILLKNNGLLPLDSKKSVGIVGPFANEMFKDWYTGRAPFTVNPLEGLIEKLGADKVKYTLGMDKIALRSNVNGKYLVPDDETAVMRASADKLSDDAVYTVGEWGYNVRTLRSEKTGLLASLRGDTFCANAEDCYNWDVFERILYDGDENNTTLIDTRLNRAGVDKDGVLKANEDNSFAREVVHSGIEDVVKLAKECDNMIVTVGIMPLVNGRETLDRPSLELPEYQQEMVKAVCAANPNTVVVVFGGYPYSINWEQENAPAILFMTHGAQSMGTALANVIYGDYSPAARANMTWYKDESGLPDIRDYDVIHGKRTYMYYEGDVLYPFGHGLSYSTFAYDNLKISSDTLRKDETLKISVDVTNTGKVDSDEVPQMYISVKGSQIIRPKIQLKGFDRVFIPAGQTVTVEFELPYHELRYWDLVRHQYSVENTDCEIMVGASSGDIRQRAMIHVEGEPVAHRDLSVRTLAMEYDDCRAVTLDEGDWGDTCVCANGEGSMIRFDRVDFDNAVILNFIASGEGEIRLCIDSEYNEIGTVAEVKTDGKDDWRGFVIEAFLVDGTHDVILKIDGKVNINDLIFSQTIYFD